MNDSIRDPRMAELEFLDGLTKRGQTELKFWDSLPPEKTFGIPVNEYREMVLHLIIEGFINGPSTESHPIADFAGSSLQKATEYYIARDIKSVVSKNSLWAVINHKGRVRLWSLRDELKSLRRREPFGILFSGEHWESDWQIAFTLRKDGAPVSLLYCDLDNFKAVNERLDHSIGDIVMQTYLRTVERIASGVGEAYRKLGDEVYVILRGLNHDGAKRVAESIRAAVESEMKEMKALDTFKLKDRPTLSIGAQTFSAFVSAEDAFKAVDARLKDAKKAGKNCVR